MDSDNLLNRLKTKTYYLNYAGKLFFHPLYVSCMTKWLIASVKLRQSSAFCCVIVDEDGISTKEEPKNLIDLRSQLQTTSVSVLHKQFTTLDIDSIKPEKNSSPISLCDTANSSTESLPFQVSYNHIVEVVMPSSFEKNCCAFISHQGHGNPLTLHVFQDDNEQLVKEVGETIQQFITWTENPSNKDKTCDLRHVRFDDLDSIRFEVLLLGKVRVNRDLPRSTAVDEAVEKYYQLKREHSANQKKISSDPNHANTHSDSHSPKAAHRIQDSAVPEENRSLAASSRKASGASQHSSHSRQSDALSSKLSNTNINLGFDKNKTKIIQVGKQSVILISSDQSCQDIDIPFNNVAYCEKGLRHKEYFGLYVKDDSHHHQVYPGVASTATTEQRPRCYVLKCSEQNVCNEIILAIKQACSSCVYGPEPLYSFHTLCRRIKTLSSNNEQGSPEMGIDLAASCISDLFNESEQRKVKLLISEASKKTPPISTFEHLIVIMDNIRLIFEERQYQHELKIKQLSDSPTLNQSVSMGKQLSILKDKARKSFGNIENLLDKYSSSPPSRVANSPAPVRSVAPAYHSDGSSEDSDFFNAEESQRRRSSTMSAVQRPSSRMRRKTGGPEHKILTNPYSSTTASNAFNAARRSFSSPFLLRLLPTLPDLKESPSEEENPASLKPSRFSFSRLFRSSPVPSKPIELTDLSKKTEAGDLCHDKTIKANRKLWGEVASDHQHPSDVSSDEEDDGIYFTATPFKRNIPRHGISKLALKGSSAFTPVNPDKASFTPVNQDKAPHVSCFNVPEESLSLKNDQISERGSPRQQMSPMDVTESGASSPVMKTRLTIHQRIFNMVGSSKSDPTPVIGPLALSDFKRRESRIKTTDDIRSAWKRVINDQIILNRIQKFSTIKSNPENETHNHARNFLLNVDHDEPMHSIWLDLLTIVHQKLECSILHAAVKREVPCELRGKIWKFLLLQWNLKEGCCAKSDCQIRLPDKPYDCLLKQLTTHQHAILIDLGRTFPTHPYFSRQMGNGQLALFNLLKAYSLVDEGVGYCQGLSFVAGVLVMNLADPNDAFDLFVHLMVKMDCRKFYLPDMAALRVAVYQLSRLLYDFHSELWHHFEKCEVTLMLFSTPWFLTMFASVLSLNLTARVFDLLFVEGPSALFKTALSLLGCHKDNLLQQSDFESIMTYIKQNLSNMNDKQVEHITNEMFTLEIGGRLRVYEAEYNVLEESYLVNKNSDQVIKDHMNSLDKKCTEYSHSIRLLEKDNVDLSDQLSAANRQIESLRQGLSDFATLDLQRKQHIEILRKENESLKKQLKKV